MRILALCNEETGEYTAFTVIDVVYDEEYSGPGFTSTDGRYYYIPEVPISDFNYVCQKLVTHGYCDVTYLGELQEIDPE